MSVKYNIIQRKNPNKLDEPAKFFAGVKADGEINLKSLAKQVAESSSTVSDTDFLAVLNELIKVMNHHLSEGKVVKLGDFGSFQISFSCEGVDTADKVNSALIKSNKITFYPGADLREMLHTVKYEKYKQ